MTNKLTTNIWIYLCLFVFFILLFIWLFEIFFLKTYYEMGVKHNLNYAIEKLINNDNYEQQEYIDKIAFESNVCIEVITKTHTNNLKLITSKGCTTSGYIYNKYKTDFISGTITNNTYEFTNPEYKNKTIVKAEKKGNNYIFITSSLEIIENTVSILSSQLLIITITILLLFIFIGYFISKRISKPIININNKAKSLKNGNYETTFTSKEGIFEINELEQTLNELTFELKETENIRREFLANVSHDIKTPLTMIKAYAEMVKDITYKDKEKRESNLNVIIEEVDRLTILVNDILNLSSLQAKTQNEPVSKINLHSVITSIIDRYDIYKEQGYSFIYNNKSDIYILGCQKRIEQIIYNLINNAIVYTGSDKIIKVELEITKKEITLYICDTGIGIKEEEKTHIWDKYYQIDKKYKRSKVGSGIGLSIVKTICENYNYQYGVISKMGQGSKFWIKFKKV